jgi:KaiC/GvpD/RAD55 family RecA-like ATPase
LAGSNPSPNDGPLNIFKQLLDPSITSLVISGNPGSGKSTLAIELLVARKVGAYLSTQVSMKNVHGQALLESILASSQSAQDPSKFAMGVDVEDCRMADANEVLESVRRRTARGPAGLIVIDSWDAVSGDLPELERLRSERKLFSMIESSGSSLIVVSESTTPARPDALADAIVELKAEIHHERVKRTLVVKKLRGQAIIRPTYLFSLAGGRFALCMPTEIRFPGQYKPSRYKRIDNPPGFFSTGVHFLDSNLNGGLVPGTVMTIEYGPLVSAADLAPFHQVLAANFVENGGCFVSIPSSGVPPHTILDPLRAFLPKELVDSRVRVGYYVGYEDPCVFETNQNSVESTFAKLWQQIGALKGPKQRPCMISLSVKKLQHVHGIDGILRNLVVSISRVKHNRDLLELIVDNSSILRDDVSSVSDSHILFETEGGILTMQSLKSNRLLTAVSYDYAMGYPHVVMMPIV